MQSVHNISQLVLSVLDESIEMIDHNYNCPFFAYVATIIMFVHAVAAYIIEFFSNRVGHKNE